MIFENRHEAGKKLAEKLKSLVSEESLKLGDAVVIALPRGGVPVGLEIAGALELPLDVCVVRKVGAPAQPELAIAAVAEGGEIVVNENVSRLLGLSRVEIEQLARPKRAEVEERVKKFRSGAAAAAIEGKTVIIVDDGLATGTTALTAVHVMKKRKAGRILLAVPVCPAESVQTFAAEVDRLIVLSTPVDFYAVGQWYRDFQQVTDDEVQAMMQQAEKTC
jgi:predicted phosphoribosyltransferase